MIRGSRASAAAAATTVGTMVGTMVGTPSSSSAAETMSREPRMPPGTEQLRCRKATLARGCATPAARGRAPAGWEPALTRPVSATLDTREAMSGGGDVSSFMRTEGPTEAPELRW